MTDLTEREIECLHGSANGSQADEIAHELGLSKKTVEKHLASARKKLKAKSTPHAIAIAMQTGRLKYKK